MIQKLATLAKLEFNDEGMTSIKKDLQRMLKFIEKLEAVDTTDVEPLVFMSEEVNVLRDDVSEHTISKEEALENTPEHDSHYIRVPKVVSNK